MSCRIVEMQEKEVISICNGCKLGYVGDIEIDTCSGKIVSVVIPGRGKFLGLFGKGENIVIPWEKIKVIGDETILVDCDKAPCRIDSAFPIQFK